MMRKTLQVQTLLPGLLLLFLVCAHARAAESDGILPNGMVSTHAVRIVDQPEGGEYRAGDVVHIDGLGCRLNSNKFQHEGGFRHKGAVFWSGPLYPGGHSLIVKLVPCKADILEQAVADTFILDRKEGNEFWATAFPGNPINFTPVDDGRGAFRIISRVFEEDGGMSCLYLGMENRFFIRQATIRYTPEEAGKMLGLCPADGFQQIEAGHVPPIRQN